VVDFELGRRLVSAEKAQAIRIALEVAGVMFGTDGSVKLRRASANEILAIRRVIRLGGLPTSAASDGSPPFVPPL